MADYDSLSAQFQLGGLKTRTTDASLLGGGGGGSWRHPPPENIFKSSRLRNGIFNLLNVIFL